MFGLCKIQQSGAPHEETNDLHLEKISSLWQKKTSKDVAAQLKGSLQKNRVSWLTLWKSQEIWRPTCRHKRPEVGQLWSLRTNIARLSSFYREENCQKLFAPQPKTSNFQRKTFGRVVDRAFYSHRRTFWEEKSLRKNCKYTIFFEI